MKMQTSFKKTRGSTSTHGGQPGSKGQLPASVLTLVPARSNSQFDWLFDNKRLTNYSKELLLCFWREIGQLWIAVTGKKGKGLKKGLLAYLNAMYLP